MIGMADVQNGTGLKRGSWMVEGNIPNNGPPPKKSKGGPNLSSGLPLTGRMHAESFCTVPSLTEHSQSIANNNNNGFALARVEEDRSSCEGSDVYFTRETIERCSPSRRDGIDLQKETYLRYSYSSFLQTLGMRLQLPQTTIATATVLCHRFFLRRSHASHDRFLIATACMFLVAKSEETARPLNSVLIVSYEICHKHDLASFHYLLPNDWFERYKERVLEAENLVLTTLNFELTVEHPYRTLFSVLDKIGLARTALVPVAWNLINEGLFSRVIRSPIAII